MNTKETYDEFLIEVIPTDDGHWWAMISTADRTGGTTWEHELDGTFPDRLSATVAARTECEARIQADLAWEHHAYQPYGARRWSHDDEDVQVLPLMHDDPTVARAWAAWMDSED